MLDMTTNPDASPTASALLLFDRAMTMKAISSDIVRAAQELNRLSDHQLSELGRAVERCVFLAGANPAQQLSLRLVAA